MRNKATIISGVIGVAILILVLGGLLWPDAPISRKSGAEREAASQARSAPSADQGGAVSRGSEAMDTFGDKVLLPVLTADALFGRLVSLVARLKGGDPDPEQTWALLQEVRDLLKKADPEQATEALLRFLKSGENIATGFGFRVGLAGALEEAPTIRTAALDWLGQINVAAADAYGADLLARPSDPDEWAVCLRNAAWADPSKNQIVSLSALWSQGLEVESWLAQPSGGFLETFDFAPYRGGVSIFSTMAQVHERSNVSEGVRWASFLAMDRMIMREPDALLEHVARERSFLALHPVTRAELISRADVTRPGQLAALDHYLGRNDVGPDEAKAFADLFPNYNQVVGHRLLSGGEMRSMEDFARSDEAALQYLERLGGRLSLPVVFRQELPRMTSRLAEHVASVRRAVDSGELIISR